MTRVVVGPAIVACRLLTASASCPGNKCPQVSIVNVMVEMTRESRAKTMLG